MFIYVNKNLNSIAGGIFICFCSWLYSIKNLSLQRLLAKGTEWVEILNQQTHNEATGGRLDLEVNASESGDNMFHLNFGVNAALK